MGSKGSSDCSRHQFHFFDSRVGLIGGWPNWIGFCWLWQFGILLSRVNGMMKNLELIIIIVLPILLGIVIRVVIQNKPRLQFLMWASLMTLWVIFLIYGSILAFSQKVSLLSRDQRPNVTLIIASILFILLGINYFVKNKGTIFRE